MGNFGFRKLRPLALALRDRYSITHFVETGTHRGQTTKWAASEFDWVTTIEINKTLYQEAKNSNLENVCFVYGDSRVKLGEVIETVPQPAIIWLDAHNAIKYDKSFSSKERCPLREELAALKMYWHFIFIDDARYYTGKGQWPGLEEIEMSLPGGYKMVIWEDVIIAVPSEVMPTVNLFVGSLA